MKLPPSTALLRPHLALAKEIFEQPIRVVPQFGPDREGQSSVGRDREAAFLKEACGKPLTGSFESAASEDHERSYEENKQLEVGDAHVTPPHALLGVRLCIASGFELGLGYEKTEARTTS